MKRLIRIGQIGFLLGMLINVSCGQSRKSGDNHPHTNALIEETSPYLLQHAHNPVDWRPWSREALEAAAEDGKLVIISIGYSSCHWCHVMEEETFENEEVAALMNEQFISIKVDREERPDVDQVYMTAAQLLTGSGGWPLNVVALPDGKPIYAGTYHSREQWTQVLRELSKLYRESPEKARSYADKAARGIQAVNLVQLPDEQPALNADVLKQGVYSWQTHWDMQWGGNSGQQKFMIPSNLDFLMNYAQIMDDEKALDFVKTTLNRMAMGGVYDQVGGGFFRYSTDPYWRVPHFEKMLYDNAQLISLYSKAYTLFKEPLYKEITLGITDYLDREMKHPGGAYYAAMDADSEGGEGAYYLWSRDQLMEILKDDFPLFADYFNIREGEAMEDGKYVPNQTVNDTEIIEKHQLSPVDWQAKKEKWRKMLMGQRQGRPAPGIDDKVITSWNALLITGFVDAYMAFGDDGFLDRALNINGFLEENNRVGNKLLHSYKSGNRHNEAFLEDYALLAEAKIELYLATGGEAYFKQAQMLMKTVHTLFYEEDTGFYRFKDDDELIAKIVKTDDGVLPSPNAVMAHNLFKLGHILYDLPSINRARQMLAAMVPNIQQAADAYSRWAKLLLHVAYPYFEVAVVGPDALKLQAEMQKKYLPNTMIVPSETPSEMPLFVNRYVEGKTYIYVCQEHSCKLPVTSVDAALQQLLMQ